MRTVLAGFKEVNNKDVIHKIRSVN